MSFKTWERRPTEIEIKAAIGQFMNFISLGEFEKAFEVCPTYKYKNAPSQLNGKDWRPDSNDSTHIKMIVNDLYETFEAYGYFDDLAEDDPTPTKENLKTWCFHITSPTEDNFKQLGLSVPDSEGDVEANTYVRGEASDITAIFSLNDLGYAWILAFKMFKVM